MDGARAPFDRAEGVFISRSRFERLYLLWICFWVLIEGSSSGKAKEIATAMSDETVGFGCFRQNGNG